MVRRNRNVQAQPRSGLQKVLGHRRPYWNRYQTVWTDNGQNQIDHGPQCPHPDETLPVHGVDRNPAKPKPLRNNGINAGASFRARECSIPNHHSEQPIRLKGTGMDRVKVPQSGSP